MITKSFDSKGKGPAMPEGTPMMEAGGGADGSFTGEGAGIEEDLRRWIVYVALKLPTMYLTNDVTFKFNSKDYFATLMQR